MRMRPSLLAPAGGLQGAPAPLPRRVRLRRVRLAARVGGVRAALIVVVLLAVAAIVPSAHAGVWAQVACVNPDGSAATSEGWSAFTSGAGLGAAASSACAPGTPMSASLGDTLPAPVFTSAGLQYTPPPGSTLVGGTLQVTLSGAGGGTDASGDAEIDEPAQTRSDARLRCTSGSRACGSSQTDYSGTFTVPRNLGGNLYVTAGCVGAAGFSCDNGARNGAWALAQVSSATLLLQNIASPTARGFTGSLLGHAVHGTGRLRMTASDPGGPGVYRIAVTIDGRTVHDATPSRNGGACVSVGNDASTGALEFDAAQPCPTSLTTTLRIPTAQLPDGTHRLVLSVTDAAGNTATPLRRTISTDNPKLTPRPAHGLRTRFAISWRGAQTTPELRAIPASAPPRSGHVAVSCTGPRCPALPSGSQPASSIATLERRLSGLRFHPGDALLITVTAPHRGAERIRLTIRPAAHPRARLLAP